MRIGLDVAQTCVERHGCGWVADRVATAIGSVCPGDDVDLEPRSHSLLGHFPTFSVIIVSSVSGTSLRADNQAWAKGGKGFAKLLSFANVV
jgi:hypothetical protein